MSIPVDVRTKQEREQSSQLRKAGCVPAVLYGLGGQADLEISEAAIRACIRQGDKLIELSGDVSESVLISNIKWDPLGVEVLHLDLIRVDPNEKVQVTVPLIVVGNSDNVKYEQLVYQLEIECEAGAIPDEINLDAMILYSGIDVIAEQVKLPDGINLLGDPKSTVIRCHDRESEKVIATPTIELTIDKDLQSFSSDDQEELLSRLQRLLSLDEPPAIVRKRKGSIKVQLELAPELAEKLFWAIKAGALSDLDVCDALLIEGAAGNAVWSGKRKTDKYDVFFCHNSQDKPYVRDVDRSLRNYGIRAWIDDDALRPGLPWQKQLESEIEKIDAVAVFVGESGIGPWQAAEIESLLNEFASNGTPVIPVFLSNCSSQPEIPNFLKRFTSVDFRKDLPNPVDQLVFGITGNRAEQGNYQAQKLGNSDGTDGVPTF